MTIIRAALIIAVIGVSSCLASDARMQVVDSVAEGFVKLALAIDQYDPGYVDAYFGPTQWRPKDKPPDTAQIPIRSLRSRADSLLLRLHDARPQPATELEKLRLQFLVVHLKAARSRINILAGARMTFDEESRELYNAVAPATANINRDSLLAELGKLLPGEGLLVDRLNTFLERFHIPQENVETVFDAALAECRRRTREHIALPDDESMVIGYVTDRPWGAYNWFKGNGHSLVEVNVEQPVSVGAVLGTLVHEAYPGHHTNLTLLEKRLYRDSGWVEYSVVPLYCPMSVISEGIANYAWDMIFPDGEGEQFIRRELFPLAGLDTSEADRYFKVRAIRDLLDDGEIEIARAYVDGKLTSAQAESALVALAIANPKEAPRKVSFYHTYRSYIICYSVGKAIVKQYMEAVPVAERWPRFIDLLSTPRTPATVQ